MLAFLLYFKVIKLPPEPKQTPKTDAAAPKGGISILLWYLAFGVGGYFGGRALGGTQLAFAGLGIGLILSFAVGFLLVSLIRHVLKPATDQAVFAALDVVLFSLFLWLAVAVFIAADAEAKNQAFQAFGEAVYKGAERMPILFWTVIAAGVMIGFVNGFRIIRRQAAQNVSGKPETASVTAAHLAQDERSDKAYRTSTAISEKPLSSNP
jgi:hypothetical protein